MAVLTHRNQFGIQLDIASVGRVTGKPYNDPPPPDQAQPERRPSLEPFILKKI
jgi:hypothetical protein